MEWYGALPERWETVSVNRVFSVSAGYGFPIEFQGNKDGELPFYKVSDINGAGKRVETSNNYVSIALAMSKGWKTIPRNAVLMAKIGAALTKNHRKINTRTCLIDNNMQALIPRSGASIDWCYYILSCIDMAQFDNGGTIPYVGVPYLKNHRIPLPPRDEQDQIVRYLDWKVSRINKLINAKHRQIALLGEMRKTVINEAVTKGGEGWREISLGNLGSFRKGFGGSREDDSDDGVACIRYGDIYRVGSYVIESPITRISGHAAASYARVYPSEILFPMSGETKEDIGIAVVNEIDEDTWCSGDCAIFTSNGSILPRFLSYAIRCPSLVRQRASMSKGDIIVHLSTGALRRLRLLVPPQEVQKKIVERLYKIENCTQKLISDIEDEITLLAEYRTRLISDVVTGKLDVRGVVVPEYEAVVDDVRGNDKAYAMEDEL